MTRSMRRLGAGLAALLLLSACSGHANSSASSPVKATLTRANFASVLSSKEQKQGTFHVVAAMTVSGQAVKASGDYRVGDGPLSANVIVAFGKQNFTLRAVNGIFYLNGASFGDSTWYRFDPSKSSNATVRSFASLGERLDMSKLLKQLSDASTSFAKDGSGGTLDGVATTKYTITVDTLKLLKAQGVDIGSAASKLPATMKYQVYVGSDGLPRRMVVDSTIVTQTDYSKWGEKVTVATPPAGQVKDLSTAG